MTAFLPQLLNFEISLTKNEEVWLQCNECDWIDLWSAYANLGVVVDEAVAHYDSTHR